MNIPYRLEMLKFIFGYTHLFALWCCLQQEQMFVFLVQQYHKFYYRYYVSVFPYKCLTALIQVISPVGVTQCQIFFANYKYNYDAEIQSIEKSQLQYTDPI